MAPKPIRIRAEDVRVGDKLVRKSDGFLFEVRGILIENKIVKLSCGGLQEEVRKGLSEKVAVMRTPSSFDKGRGAVLATQDARAATALAKATNRAQNDINANQLHAIAQAIHQSLGHEAESAHHAKQAAYHAERARELESESAWPTYDDAAAFAQKLRAVIDSTTPSDPAPHDMEEIRESLIDSAESRTVRTRTLRGVLKNEEEALVEVGTLAGGAGFVRYWKRWPIGDRPAPPPSFRAALSPAGMRSMLDGPTWE